MKESVETFDCNNEKPKVVGFYPGSICWDAQEGAFPAGLYWDGQEWVSHGPPCDYVNEVFDDAKKAEARAYELDLGW